MTITCLEEADLLNALWSLDPFLDPDFWWGTDPLLAQRHGGIC